ncbi:MAG TPA: hypothetical protein QGF58_30815 [Myxococcota bacterium]|nr:hypothetical protein [Myxococcota bacterium]
MKRLLIPTVLIALVACEGGDQATSEAKKQLAQPKSEMEKVCGRAFTGIEGARSKLEQRLTEEQKTQLSPLPPKADFVAICKDLDPATAKCLDPNWYEVAADECGPLLEKAPKEVMEKFATLGDEPEAEQTDGEETEAAEEGAEGAEGEGAEAGADEKSAGDLVQEAMKQ